MINTLKNIVVVGQGAIGLLWYHHLREASLKKNQKITTSLLASNQHAISVDGLQNASYQFTSYVEKNTKTYPLKYCQTTNINNADILILCLKSYQIVKALEDIAKEIPSKCIIILAHNGMGTSDEVINLLPKNQGLLAMLTTHGCLRTKPLSITHTGLGQSDIGLLSGNISTSSIEQLTTLLNHALPHVNYHQDIIKKQWTKLAINCVINPITAINDISNGDINKSKYQSQRDRLLTEIIAISNMQNIGLVFDDLQEQVFNVAKATAKNASSMRCDVLAGKSTEIDYINGYIHRLGVQYSIATPENTRVWQQVLTLSS